MMRNGTWPKLWAAEEVTIIPKVHDASTLEQCRNVSCTSIFTKLAETFMLYRLQEEIPPDPLQFGGMKGSGTTHLLAEMNTNIIETLDDSRAAATLISLDLSKAFNHMDHSNCVSSLAHYRASNQSLAIAAAFLTGRKMRIKLNNHTFSSYRQTPGGSPQGTKSGNYFFCIATRRLDTPLPIEIPCSDTPLPQPSPQTSPTSSPLGGSRLDLRLNGRTAVIDSDAEDEQGQPWHEHVQPPRWVARPVEGKKYIDDLSALSKDNTSSGISYITEMKERRLLWSEGTQLYLDSVTKNAAAIGLAVNEEKTQLLCVNGARNYEISSFVNVGETA